MPFPVNVEFVHEAQAKLGIKFPPSFVTKMTTMNGGSVIAGSEQWELHPFLDRSDRKRLARTANDIIRETEVARGWIGFPQTAVAIGANGGGDRLVLIPRTDDPSLLAHEVYWWDHETGKINEVAGDFSEIAGR